jgi:hypothetical protein
MGPHGLLRITFTFLYVDDVCTSLEAYGPTWPVRDSCTIYYTFLVLQAAYMAGDMSADESNCECAFGYGLETFPGLLTDAQRFFLIFLSNQADK